VATFAEPEQARKAMEALGRAGIEADEMSVRGRAVAEAGADSDTRQRDVATTGALASRAGSGGVIGAVVGALVAVGACLAFGLSPGSAGFWIAAVGGLIAGGAVGGMIGGIRKLPLAQEWELTYDEDASADGGVRVTVQAADEEQLERARKVLASERPERLEQVDASGRSVS
jgi:hypothetical protein